MCFILTTTRGISVKETLQYVQEQILHTNNIFIELNELCSISKLNGDSYENEEPILINKQYIIEIR